MRSTAALSAAFNLTCVVLVFFFLTWLVTELGEMAVGNGQYQEKSLGGSRAFTTYHGIPTK